MKVQGWPGRASMVPPAPSPTLHRASAPPFLVEKEKSPAGQKLRILDVCPCPPGQYPGSANTQPFWIHARRLCRKSLDGRGLSELNPVSCQRWIACGAASEEHFIYRMEPLFRMHPQRREPCSSEECPFITTVSREVLSFFPNEPRDCGLR